MELVLNWLAKYSKPVVALIAIAAVLLFLIKNVTEKAIETKFDEYGKELALRLERRSRFEERLLLDRYELVSELFDRLERPR